MCKKELNSCDHKRKAEDSGPEDDDCGSEEGELSDFDLHALDQIEDLNLAEFDYEAMEEEMRDDL